MDSVAQRWFGAFMETVKTHETSTTLREAAMSGELKHWTAGADGHRRWHLPEDGLARSGARTPIRPAPGAALGVSWSLTS